MYGYGLHAAIGVATMALACSANARLKALKQAVPLTVVNVTGNSAGRSARRTAVAAAWPDRGLRGSAPDGRGLKLDAGW